jgi:hypothetical protein
VFSIETDGIKNIWPTKPRSSESNDDSTDDYSRKFLEEGHHMLTKAQMLWVGRSFGIRLIILELRDRLQGAPWRRLDPPVRHIGLTVISWRRAFP